VQRLGIIQEEDEDFDKVRANPQLSDSGLIPSQTIDPQIFAHVTIEQRRETVGVIDRYREC
jgi:hypothetical protein